MKDKVDDVPENKAIWQGMKASFIPGMKPSESTVKQQETLLNAFQHCGASGSPASGRKPNSSVINHVTTCPLRSSAARGDKGEVVNALLAHPWSCEALGRSMRLPRAAPSRRAGAPRSFPAASSLTVF